MAFKRSAVRSRLSPPKKRLISYEIRRFCNFFDIFIFPVHNSCIIEEKKCFFHFSKIAFFATFLPIFGKSKKFFKNFLENFFSLFSHHIHTSYDTNNFPLLDCEGGNFLFWLISLVCSCHGMLGDCVNSPVGLNNKLNVCMDGFTGRLGIPGLYNLIPFYLPLI